MARILITCGPTREPLDPVRYLSNASSGQTGLDIASEAIGRGHQVDLVLGPVALAPPPGARVVHVITCEQMLKACRDLHPACQAMIGVAAVCDFRPAVHLNTKKNRAGNWNLELVPNPDILLEMRAGKGPRVHAGFALETETDLDRAVLRARKKLEEKGLDWIVLNTPAALLDRERSYVLLGRASSPEILGDLSKKELARRLVEVVENTLKSTSPGADKTS